MEKSIQPSTSSSGNKINRLFLAAKKHYLIILALTAIVLARTVLLPHSDEIVLINQDFNPRHFTMLFWNNDIPVFDDNGAGENAKYMGFSQLYYAIPLLGYKIGIPLFIFEWFHILFDIPLLLAGFYTLSYVMTRKTAISIFASFFAFYCVSETWGSFGYSLIMKDFLYYSDFSLIIICFFLASLYSGRMVLSGFLTGLTVLFHPTLGVNCCILLFARLFIGCAFHNEDKKKAIISLGIAGVSCIIAAGCTSLALSPEHIDPEIRNILIASYGHLAPHINGRFFYRFAFCVLIILAAIVIFKRKIEFLKNASESSFVTVQALLVSTIIQPFFVYAVTFVFIPSIYIMLSPSRFWTLPLIFVSVFLGQLCYKLVEKIGVFPVWGLLILVLFKWKMTPYLLFFKYSSYFYFTILLALILHASNKEKLARLYDNLRKIKPTRSDLWFLFGIVVLLVLTCYYRRLFSSLALISAALLVERLIYTKYRPEIFIKFTRLVVIVLLLVLIAGNVFVVLNNPMLEVKSYEYDISRQINEKLPKNTLIVPYYSPDLSNKLLSSSLRGCIRTYSRRGVIYYWQIGFNAFFDSKMRYDIEDRCFKAAGVDVFSTLLEKSRKLRKENILGYYFGSEKESDLTYSENVRDVLLCSMSEFKNKIKGMSLDEFKTYASKIKATHLLMPYDSGRLPPEIKPVCMNKYFCVIEIAP
ncbi:MAG: hypothetical protein A2020_00435 [Lentisphaerae bacterium GWF2_45_14]|nr:MAG: hypothetical protein A2020_00435 [Lentisphaerae bacterium GWF2_45_14]